MGRGTALITGASSGIGADLARLCAEGGYDLVLIARRLDRIQQLCDELSRLHGIVARALAADLADAAAPDAIARAIAPTVPDLLINNAGFGVSGPFAKTNWDEERALMEVNMIAPARLIKLFLPAMIARGSGRILNVASTAAFVPGPMMAMYYASKAFLFSFSRAVANEAEGTGVTVTVLCPGPTRTEFGEVARMTGTRLFHGPAMSSGDVAREGYRAMMEGRPEIIAGAKNRWMMLGIRFAPRTMLARITRGLNSSAQ